MDKNLPIFASLSNLLKYCSSVKITRTSVLSFVMSLFPSLILCILIFCLLFFLFLLRVRQFYHFKEAALCYIDFSICILLFLHHILLFWVLLILYFQYLRVSSILNFTVSWTEVKSCLHEIFLSILFRHWLL